MKIWTEKSEQELKDFFELYFKTVQSFLFMSNNSDRNFNIGVNGNADLGEIIAAIFFDGKTPGSSGLGYDVIINDPEKAAVEAKTSSWIQAVECENKECTWKMPFFKNKCTECNSPRKQNHKQDSRWGINAKKYIEEKINKYYFLVHIDSKDQTKPPDGFVDIQIYFYIIKNDNSYFEKYAKRQNFYSKKSNTLNFLPRSFDFYMSTPSDLGFVNIKINYEDSSEKPIFTYNLNKTSPNKLIEFDLSVLKKQELELLPEKYGAPLFGKDLEKYGITLREKKYNKNRGAIVKHKKILN